MKSLIYGFAVLSLTFCLWACTPVDTVKTWKDDSHSHKLRKVFIVAATQEESLRKMAENVFASMLKERGVQAVPSHGFLPSLGDRPSQVEMLENAKASGSESILLMRSVGHDVVKSNTIGSVHYESIFATKDNVTFYGQGFVRTGVQTDSDLFHVQTDIYDVKTQKRFWSSLNDVWIAETEYAAVRPFVDTVISHLDESQLLK